MSYTTSSHTPIGDPGVTSAIHLRTLAPRVDRATVVTFDYGPFYWDASSTASDNGTTVVKVSDITTGRWLAVGVMGLDSEFAAANAAIVKKLTVTITTADLTAAATTETVAIGATAANTRVVGVAMHTLTPFTGGTISAMAVDIGTSGDVDALVDGADVFSAAVDGQPSTMPAGIAPNKLYASAPTFNAVFTATGDNVDQASAGSVVIDILYVELA